MERQELDEYRRIEHYVVMLKASILLNLGVDNRGRDLGVLIMLDD